MEGGREVGTEWRDRERNTMETMKKVRGRTRGHFFFFFFSTQDTSAVACVGRYKLTHVSMYLQYLTDIVGTVFILSHYGDSPPFKRGNKLIPSS